MAPQKHMSPYFDIWIRDNDLAYRLFCDPVGRLITKFDGENSQFR